MGTAESPASPPGYQPPPYTGAVSGLDDNLAAALSYSLGIVTGVLFLALDPYNKRPFVRFHAFQSIFFSVGWIILSIAVSISFAVMGGLHMWWLFGPLRALFSLLGFGLWLYCMYKAYNREMYQLPVIGPIAASQAGS